jgi:DNA-binding transcriptional regulator LsrR (DeoR family)
MMEDKSIRESLARMYADGMSRKDIADALGVNPSTISGWVKRADVQALVSKLIEERTNRVLRHTDKMIEGRLTSGATIELDELLKIRREFAGQKVEVTSRDGDKASATDELMQRLHENPELLDKLLADGAA